MGKSVEIIRRVHGDHEGIMGVSGGLGGSKGMCETRNTCPNVGHGSGIQGVQGGSVSVVGVPVCQGVMSDRLATRANKGKQGVTRKIITDPPHAQTIPCIPSHCPLLIFLIQSYSDHTSFLLMCLPLTSPLLFKPYDYHL